MTSKRLFYVLIGLLVLLGGLGISGAVVGNSMLGKRSNELVNLKIENALIDKQQVDLVKAKKDVEKYTDLKATVKAIVPQDKDQARTVREIINIASASKIGIASITFPSSNLGQAQPKATPTTEEGGTTTAKTATTTSSITQVKAVDGLSGVYQLEIGVQSDSTPVAFSNLIGFLQQLEKNRRTASVTSLIITPDSKDRNKVTFNLTLNVYVKP